MGASFLIALGAPLSASEGKMKQTYPDTLSAYLLEKANRFQLYPRRVYGEGSEISRAALDLIRRSLVEWRKTFAPQVGNETSDFLTNPISLDEQYCRDLLSKIPEIVERTLKLSSFILKDIADSDVVQLREAANCFIFGLPLAAIALARAAVEAALRRKLGQTVDKKIVAEAELSRLINLYGPACLTKEARNLSNKVRIAANNVLHETGVSSATALETIESARKVILELSKSTAKPASKAPNTPLQPTAEKRGG